MSTPIHFQNISLKIPDKVLLDEVTLTIFPGEFVALLGNNGTGKSTLLRHLLKEKHVAVRLVEQSPHAHDKSGGEALMLALEQAFESQPDVLFLDEPTNHLDQTNQHQYPNLYQ